MPLHIDRQLLSAEMIKNFPAPAATAVVEIIAPCAIRGTHVAVGEIIEVTAEDASQLFANTKARLAREPVEDSAEEQEKTAAKAQAAADKKAAAESAKTSSKKAS